METKEPQSLSMKLLSEDEFLAAYNHASKPPPENANHFFNSFLYKVYLFNGNPSLSVDLGVELLQKCKQTNPEIFSNIHKGTAYYWIAMAAFLMNDMERAIFFIDAAVNQDLRLGSDPNENPSPALLFMLIDGASDLQAAKQMVVKTQARFDELIEFYNQLKGKSQLNFTIKDLREKFIIPTLCDKDKKWRSNVTTMISFCMEIDNLESLFEIRVDDGTSEPFFMHLFKGCVLFETILKECPINNGNSPSTIEKNIKKFHSQLGIPVDYSVGNCSLQSIIKDLDHFDNSIQSAIKFSNRTRNAIGHNLGWPIIRDKDQYEILFKLIISSCFHAIVKLY